MSGKLTPKDFEQLSEIVSRAIAASPQVRRVLRRLRKNHEVDLNRCLAITLKLQQKKTAAKKQQSETKSPRKRRTSQRGQKSSGQYIDGKRLSQNEVSFEEFYSQRFDSDEWLRRIKVRLEGS